VAIGGDRGRVIYVSPWRIDVVRRAGTARCLSDAKVALSVARALDAAEAPAPGSVTVVMTDDDELAELNAAHLGHEGPTDVLSFPMLQPSAFRGGGSGLRPGRRRSPPGRTHVGDIAISVERALDQARTGRGGQTGDVRWSGADELRLLVTHGTLHLCGWDHATPEQEQAMRALEQQLLASA
jgi:probable rRNA maturation factor